MANGSNGKLHKDLLLACGWGKEIDVVLLLQQGASVKVQDQNGRNCLHYAASKGHTNIVEILLLKKCNANAKDKFGSTPLHQAAVNGHTECAAILIEGGADVNSQDENGNTPLYEAVWNNQFEIADLFLNSEADVNIRNQESLTPLHLACQNNNTKIIQDLIKWGANMRSQIKNGNTPLHIAVQNSNIEAVKILLSLEADINFQNHDGDSPLHICAELGDKKIARLLLESGQPYEASLNNVGDSAKDIAIRLGNKEVGDIIPTPMLARKQSKKLEGSKSPGSPKRSHGHRASQKQKRETKAEKKSTEHTDSLERPPRVVIQSASFDNLRASDSCSSLSSLWLPVPDSRSPLPMDVHWQRGASPAEDEKEITTLKEHRKADVLSQSDGSVVKHPKYQLRKKRRKQVGNHSVKQENGEEGWEEEMTNESKKVTAVKSPNFKKKKHGGVKKIHGRKLKKVLEQGEEELSIASPTEKRKGMVITEALISSPRVKGRAELKTESSQKRTVQQNGSAIVEEKLAKEQKLHKKGLKEYLIDTLTPRRSPAGTEGDNSWTLGSLEHKKSKEHRKEVDLHQHLKLTEKDIEALIKSDTLERKKSDKEKKKSKKGHRNIYMSDSESEQEIVIIRLDPSLESPKKSKQANTKVDKNLETFSNRKDDRKQNKSIDERDVGERKSGRAKSSSHHGSEKKKESKEKKVDSKEWPKFDVNKQRECNEKQKTNGRIRSPHAQECNGTYEKPRRHRHHHKTPIEPLSFPARPQTPTPEPALLASETKEVIFHKVHKLEKRFRQFLTLTTEKLEEQKDSDNKHFNTLKNNISSMERHLQRTTRENAVEIVENLTKELNDTMKKWTHILRQNTPGGVQEFHDKDTSEGGSSHKRGSAQERGSAEERGGEQEGSCPKLEECGFRETETENKTVATGEQETKQERIRGKNSSSDTSRSSGFDIIQSCEKDNEADCVKHERTDHENTWEPEREFPDHKQTRAAPLGRSDESSPGLQSRYSGDGDHMSLEKWYEEQLKEAERKWELKAITEQEAMRNRIKELEDQLFKYTGVHSTMV